MHEDGRHEMLRQEDRGRISKAGEELMAAAKRNGRVFGLKAAIGAFDSFDKENTTPL